MRPVTAFNQPTQHPHNTACDSKLLCVVPMMDIVLYSPAFENKSLNTFHKQSIQQAVLQNKCQMSNTNYSSGINEFYIHGFVHRESNKCPTRCDLFSLLYFCRQIYMFRVLTPIIRSSYNCNYSFWYWLTGSTTIRSRC